MGLEGRVIAVSVPRRTANGSISSFHRSLLSDMFSIDCHVQG